MRSKLIWKLKMNRKMHAWTIERCWGMSEQTQKLDEQNSCQESILRTDKQGVKIYEACQKWHCKQFTWKTFTLMKSLSSMWMLNWNLNSWRNRYATQKNTKTSFNDEDLETFNITSYWLPPSPTNKYVLGKKDDIGLSFMYKAMSRKEFEDLIHSLCQ